MKENVIRKRHRYIGICLAFFIILQALSGLLLSLGDSEESHDHQMLVEQGMTQQEGGGHVNIHGGPSAKGQEVSPWIEILHSIHHGGGIPGAIYRVALSLGLLGMALSGSLIFIKTKKRLNRAKE